MFLRSLVFCVLVLHGHSSPLLRDGEDEENCLYKVSINENITTPAPEPESTSSQTPHIELSTMSTNKAEEANKDQFMCHDGQLIEISWKCDGVDDCLYGEDERDCPAEVPTIESSTVPEIDTSETLPEKTDVNNQLTEALLTWKNMDLPFTVGEDGNCVIHIISNFDGFMCDETCLINYLKCDGEIHCSDGLDERNCESETTTLDITTEEATTTEKDLEASELEETPHWSTVRNEAKKDQFMCPDGQLIEISWKCDGVDNCLYGEDERDCPAEVPTIESSTVPEIDTCETLPEKTDENNQLTEALLRWKNMDLPFTVGEDGNCVIHIISNYNGFMCDETCLPNYFKCDGDIQCSDGSDERNCESETTTLDITTTEEATTTEKASETSELEETPHRSTARNVSTSSWVDKEAINNEHLILNSKDLSPLPITVNVHVQNMNNYFGLNNKMTAENTEVEKVEGKEKKKRFELDYTTANWMEAHALCKSKGGDLASISSQEENASVLQTLKSTVHTVRQVWIGGICPDKQGSCYWTDSWKPFNYKSWSRDEPNHLYYDSANEMCVQFKLQNDIWLWNDYLCSKELPFVCQYFDEELPNELL